VPKHKAIPDEPTLDVIQDLESKIDKEQAWAERKEKMMVIV
jgi:hypothetical protein